MIGKWKIFQNRRQRVLFELVCSVVFLLVVCIGGVICTEMAVETDFSRKNLAPCMQYLFGTEDRKSVV